MGGPSYDRDVYPSSSTSGWRSSYSSYSSFGESSYSATKLNSSVLHASMKPNGKILESNTKNPIIIVLDVTGSNIKFARVVYDKLPMFYGQIEQKKYLKDFDISICAVGDAYCDDYPLQIGSFAKGIKIDSWIEKLVLEEGGGVGLMESYELMAYYLYKNTRFAPGSKPIIFFIGDEKPYSTVEVSQARKFGIECDQKGIEPFSALREKVDDNVFMFLNKYSSREFRPEITSTWEKLLAPQHVVKIQEQKSIVDLMLGVVAMISEARTLESYKVDMLERGQTQDRVDNVSKSLNSLANIIVTPNDAGNASIHKGKRL